IRNAEFNFNDFLGQIQQIRNMGGVRAILSMVPGMSGNAALKNLDLGEKEIDKCETIVFSMTHSERLHPSIIGGSRRKRIAAGSGTTIQDVNQLCSRFEQMKKMMKKMSKGQAAAQQSATKKRRGKVT